MTREEMLHMETVTCKNRWMLEWKIAVLGIVQAFEVGLLLFIIWKLGR